MFVALCNILERLREESVIDMYQTVKILRQQRVWMVQTEDQYRFCYTVVLKYLNSFDLCLYPTKSDSITQFPKSPTHLYNLNSDHLTPTKTL